MSTIEDEYDNKNVVFISIYETLHNCKAHRATLIQPVVHLRRPDMQGWDGWLHVNPFGFGASEDTGSSVVEVGAAV